MHTVARHVMTSSSYNDRSFHSELPNIYVDRRNTCKKKYSVKKVTVSLTVKVSLVKNQTRTRKYAHPRSLTLTRNRTHAQTHTHTHEHTHTSKHTSSTHICTLVDISLYRFSHKNLDM